MHHTAKAHAAFVGLPKAYLIYFGSSPVRALVWEMTSQPSWQKAGILAGDSDRGLQNGLSCLTHSFTYI